MMTFAPPGLGPMDRVVLAIDGVMRELGGIGFETQVFVRLKARLDVERLRRGVAGLCRRHPVIAARLEAPYGGAEPCWRLRPGAVCPVEEAHLAAPDTGALLAWGAQLLAVPRELERQAPLTIYVVHSPGGPDAVMVQYNHVLMDIYAVVPMLALINRLADAAGSAAEHRDAVDDDPLPAKLRSLPWGSRLSGVRHYLDVALRQLRPPTAILGGPAAPAAGAPLYRCLSRSLEAEATAGVAARAGRACGLKSLSMSLLASAYRTLAASSAGSGRQTYVTGIGIDLGLRTPDRLLLRNLVSIVPVQVYTEELADRDELMRTLCARLRERLRRRNDWGLVQLASLLQRRPRLLAAFARGTVASGLSFWFAYIGALDGIGPAFCGVETDEVFVTAPGCPPAGTHLIAHKFRGRLALQMSYMPAFLPDQAAEAFLDALLRDAVSG